MGRGGGHAQGSPPPPTTTNNITHKKIYISSSEFNISNFGRKMNAKDQQNKLQFNWARKEEAIIFSHF
jgi:hypothetical protein